MKIGRVFSIITLVSSFTTFVISVSNDSNEEKIALFFVELQDTECLNSHAFRCSSFACPGKCIKKFG